MKNLIYEDALADPAGFMEKNADVKGESNDDLYAVMVKLGGKEELDLAGFEATIENMDTDKDKAVSASELTAWLKKNKKAIASCFKHDYIPKALAALDKGSFSPVVTVTDTAEFFFSNVDMLLTWKEANSTCV